MIKEYSQEELDNVAKAINSPFPKTNATTETLTRVFTIMVGKYPTFNPEWSLEAQKAWFDGWDKIMDKTLLILSKLK